MFKRILVAVAGTAAILPASATASSHVAHYKGKTKEGTKISFVLNRGWIDDFSTLLPTTCLSAQGATPKVDFTEWQIPYKYRPAWRQRSTTETRPSTTTSPLTAEPAAG